MKICMYNLFFSEYEGHISSERKGGILNNNSWYNKVFMNKYGKVNNYLLKMKVSHGYLSIKRSPRVIMHGATLGTCMSTNMKLVRPIFQI